jgi:hypothetical protein
MAYTNRIRKLQEFKTKVE